MYLDIETVGDVANIPELRPILVNVGGDVITRMPDFLDERDCATILDRMSNEIVYTFNGTKFDFQVLANQPYLSNKTEELKEICLKSVDIHLNICIQCDVSVSLSSLATAVGEQKDKGWSIPALFNEGYYEDICRYSGREYEVFKRILNEYSGTSSFPSVFRGKWQYFYMPKLFVVSDLIEKDNGRWRSKYEWLLAE